MINSKNKGNSFERIISNILSEKFKDITGKSKGFIRNIDSGSYFGGKNSQRIDTHLEEFQKFGDIICPKNFVFSIECKYYKNPPSLKNILNNSVKQWDEWLKQCERDATLANKKPLLIVKYNNCDIICFSKEKIENLYSIKYKDYFVYKFLDFINSEIAFFEFDGKI